MRPTTYNSTYLQFLRVNAQMRNLTLQKAAPSCHPLAGKWRTFRRTDMKTFLAFILILIATSCSTKKGLDEQVFYIIKHPDNLHVDTSDIPSPPPPPLIFYGRHNFVLVDTSRVFYHDNYVFYSCGNGVDFSKPPRLFLTPDSLTEISIEYLQTFLKNNIHDSIQSRQWTSANISSYSDTIKNRAFKIITEYFKSKNIKRYGIRNWTEEETFVVTAKMNNSIYDPTAAIFKLGFDVNPVPSADSTGN